MEDQPRSKTLKIQIRQASSSTLVSVADRTPAVITLKLTGLGALASMLMLDCFSSARQMLRVATLTIILVPATSLLLWGTDVFATSDSVENDPLTELMAIESAGLSVRDTRDRLLEHYHADLALVPASTTKLVTALLALERWGEDYRFTTDFHFHRPTRTLWVQAAGDPFLVSEEIAEVAHKLSRLDSGPIAAIGLDVSLFDTDLVVPGAGTSDNPYDAIPSAIAGNFNTLFLKKLNGVVASAEDQTPLTPFARSFASQIDAKPVRINTGRQSRPAERYFAEVLAAMLRKEGVLVADEVVWGEFPVPAGQRADLVHSNTRTLGKVVQLMLKYSTNFIANQLVLVMAAEAYAQPANFELVRDYMESTLVRKFGWKHFALYEGAGLSLQNRLTPEQLLDVLTELEIWKHLMPEIAPGILAKTGTLNNVSTLAGFLVDEQRVRRFAVMVNDSTAAGLTQDVAGQLLDSKLLPESK